ncbi:MAG: alpha/beta fold hydrolase [bacterium]|nr:alpha/beta fold hydrolase [bacterium]
MRIVLFILGLLLAVFLVVAGLVITQDFQIYPEVTRARIARYRGIRVEAPRDITRLSVLTVDKETLDVWYLKAKKQFPPVDMPISQRVFLGRVDSDESVGPTVGTRRRFRRDELPRVAIIFRGTDLPISAYLPMQRWLEELGISSYVVDYRGFGESSGWPTEEGFNIDADAVWSEVIQREKVKPKQVVVIGHAIGASVAAQISSDYQPGALLLVSAFTSLKDIISIRPVIGSFVSLLHSTFEVEDYVGRLFNTCLIVAHGEGDKVVLDSNARKLAKAYRGDNKVYLVTAKRANHNNTFEATKGKLTEALMRCYADGL